jgi:hypothetical protein
MGYTYLVCSRSRHDDQLSGDGLPLKGCPYCQIDHLLSFIVREWPAGGWIVSLPPGQTFVGGEEIDADDLTGYYFKERSDAVNAALKFLR